MGIREYGGVVLYVNRDISLFYWCIVSCGVVY